MDSLSVMLFHQRHFHAHDLYHHLEGKDRGRKLEHAGEANHRKKVGNPYKDSIKARFLWTMVHIDKSQAKIFYFTWIYTSINIKILELYYVQLHFHQIILKDTITLTYFLTHQLEILCTHFLALKMKAEKI